MTDVLPDEVDRAFETHEAYERTDDGYAVATTAFESTVIATDTDGVGLRYTVTVRPPTLAAAVEGSVGDAVRDGWLETLERRLEDAPSATRRPVDLDAFAVETGADALTVTYEFTHGNPDAAAELAKTFVEFVEGTYVQGVIPGYEYQSPVSDLLRDAQQSDGGPGGTPL
jgi:hypothetical protein